MAIFYILHIRTGQANRVLQTYVSQSVVTAQLGSIPAFLRIAAISGIDIGFGRRASISLKMRYHLSVILFAAYLGEIFFCVGSCVAASGLIVDFNVATMSAVGRLTSSPATNLSASS